MERQQITGQTPKIQRTLHTSEKLKQKAIQQMSSADFVM